MKKSERLSAEPEFSSLPEALAFRAGKQPGQTAYTFLQGKDRIPITYAQLHDCVTRQARFLIDNGMAGKHAILLYPPGFDFIISFFACLFAGVIAVPASPPATDRLMARIADIIDDAHASMILTSGEMRGHLQTLEPPAFNSIPMVVTDALYGPEGISRVRDAENAGEIPFPEIDGDAIAFLQYTSGSTGSPKGVMITHKNIIHNSGLIREANRMTPSGVGLIWLPMYHDMGIMTGIIYPVHVGFVCHLMSPLDFIRDPLSWIRHISDNQVTHTGGPNFAYAVCTRRFDPDQLKGVDLSSWQVAFCGAEPICPETMRAFTETFAPYGFRAESLMPCYGLAESTVGVCWSKFGNGPVYKDVDSEYLKHNIIAPPQSLSTTRQLISCGRTDGGLEIAIVDPASREKREEDEIGEIWVTGDSVAAGYWNKPVDSKDVFEAAMVNSPQAWLRTGDLGFISARELYITGRIKDLIIIRGKNHYPQDIESSVQKVHPAIRQGTVIAFSADISGEESLVVALEIKPGHDVEYDDILKSVRQAVSADHQLVPEAVLLLAPQAIPKTSSGKLQRKKCKSLFESNELNRVGQWSREGDDGLFPESIKR